MGQLKIKGARQSSSKLGSENGVTPVRAFVCKLPNRVAENAENWLGQWMKHVLLLSTTICRLLLEALLYFSWT
jgi:hypothetical protein